MRRLENVVSGVTSGRQILLDIPPGHSEIQLVFDRTRFELPDTRKPGPELFRCELNFGDGWFGAGFDDARVEGERAPRPGQRMLWSFCRWHIPRGAEAVDVRIRARHSFNCSMHVDFL